MQIDALAAGRWRLGRVFASCLALIGAVGCVTPGAQPDGRVPQHKALAIESHHARGEASALTDVRVRRRLERRIERLEQRQGEIEAWVSPLLASYLPPASRVVQRVQLGVHLARPVLVQPDRVALDVAAPRWDDHSMWVGVISGLYLASLADLRPPPLTAAPTNALEFRQWFLDQLQRLGMATYVAGHGVDLGSSTADFTLATPREVVEARVQVIQQVLRALRSGLPPIAAWRQLKSAQRQDEVLAVTGAYMAKVLEEHLGKAGLVQLVQQGPAAFYMAYTATKPGALVFVPMPLGPGDRLKDLVDERQTVAH